MTITQVPADPSNYRRGRTRLIDMLVIHVEQGSNQGTAATFREAEHHASAHYGIARDGSVIQFVGEVDTAWHAGNAAVNSRSIGIELEGFVESLAMPDAQMAALVAMVRDLCARHRIPVNRQSIIGHDEVPDAAHPGQLGGAGHHRDPGPLFPWSDFMARLAAPLPLV